MTKAYSAFFTFFICVALGLIGGLVYTWQINPQQQYDTNPGQLGPTGKRDWLIMIAAAHAKDGDLLRAAQRLREVQLSWQDMAENACALSKTSFIATNNGITSVRLMVKLAESQGATGCASLIVPANTPTPLPTPTAVTPTATIIPAPSKTAPPPAVPTFTIPPTRPEATSATPSGNYTVRIEAYCNAKLPALIEITVQDPRSEGIPGVEIEVSTLERKEIFFTGLKPERGAGYADFQMSKGGNYTVVLPGLSDRTRPLEPVDCNVPQRDGGGRSQTSYRVFFTQSAARN